MNATPWHELAKIWGAIALFHPWVQDRGGEWEVLLGRLLSERVAADPLPPHAADDIVASLLRALGDSATRIISPKSQAPEPSATPGPAITRLRLPGNIQLIRIANWFGFRIGPGHFGEWQAAIHGAVANVEAAAAEGAAGLILDVTETGENRIEDAELSIVYGRMRSELLARLVTAATPFPSLARVQRVGYHDPCEPGGAFGSYLTEWVSQRGPKPVVPADGGFVGPLVVITGPQTSSHLAPLLMALQRTGRAVCVGQAGYAYQVPGHRLRLNQDRVLQLRQFTLMWDGVPIRFQPDVLTSDPLTVAERLIRREVGDPIARLGSTFPPLLEEATDPPLPGRRMAGIIKLWTAVKFTSPYPALLERWDDGLVPALTEALRADSDMEYSQVCQRLLSHMPSGHNFMISTSSGRPRLGYWAAGFAPAIRLARRGGEVTVVGAVATPGSVQTGDVLVAVGGEPIAARESRLRPLCAALHEGAIDHALLPALLDGPEGGEVLLKVRRSNGTEAEVALVATRPTSFVSEPPAMATLPPFMLLGGSATGIGYLDASRVTIETLSEALAALATARGLVIDLRRYPTLPAPLTSLRQFMRYPMSYQPQRRPVLTGPEQPPFGWLENRFWPEDTIQPVAAPDRRPIAALIGGGTVSLGEDWAYQLKYACGALLVGTPTAGGTGANAFVHLPGGRASFSGAYGLDVDGQPAEGRGLQPALLVGPGMVQGQDGVVLAAAQALVQ